VEIISNLFKDGNHDWVVGMVEYLNPSLIKEVHVDIPVLVDGNVGHTCISKLVLVNWDLEILNLLEPGIWSFVVWDILESTFGDKERYDQFVEFVAKKIKTQPSLTRAFVGLRSLPLPEYIAAAISSIAHACVNEIDASSLARLVYWLPISEMTEFVKAHSNVLLQPTSDCMHLSVIMKYLVVCQEGWNRQIVLEIVEGCLRLVDDSKTASRFCLFQLLGVVPELVPSGLIIDLKEKVLGALAESVDKECSSLVRRQLAVTVTNWYSLSS
jgi:hypothetical protein